MIIKEKIEKVKLNNLIYNNKKVLNYILNNKNLLEEIEDILSIVTFYGNKDYILDISFIDKLLLTNDSKFIVNLIIKINKIDFNNIGIDINNKNFIFEKKIFNLELNSKEDYNNLLILKKIYIEKMFFLQNINQLFNNINKKIFLNSDDILSIIGGDNLIENFIKKMDKNFIYIFILFYIHLNMIFFLTKKGYIGRKFYDNFLINFSKKELELLNKFFLFIQKTPIIRN